MKPPLLDSPPVTREEVDQARALLVAVEGTSSMRTMMMTSTDKCDHMADLSNTGHHVQNEKQLMKIPHF